VPCTQINNVNARSSDLEEEEWDEGKGAYATSDLKARKSNKRWKMDTTMVTANSVGLVSANISLSWSESVSSLH
jgi:hypothetical protein